MRISDWSSDVCSSDLDDAHIDHVADLEPRGDDRHRLEPGRLADQLAFQLALAFEKEARRPADARSVERLLLFVEQGLESLEAVVQHRFVDLVVHRRGGRAGAARIFEAVRHRVIGPAHDIERRLEILLGRSEEHTSELQSLMRISYAVFCLKKKNTTNTIEKHKTDDKKV